MKKAPLFSPHANQDLRSWVIFITKCARQVVIARRRSRRGVHVYGSFEFRVGKLCESMAADARSAEQKEGLTTAMNELLASNLPELLRAENLGVAKDSLVNAITATYPDATNKLQALIDALASHMG